MREQSDRPLTIDEFGGMQPVERLRVPPRFQVPPLGRPTPATWLAYRRLFAAAVNDPLPFPLSPVECEERVTRLRARTEKAMAEWRARPSRRAWGLRPELIKQSHDETLAELDRDFAEFKRRETTDAAVLDGRTPPLPRRLRPLSTR